MILDSCIEVLTELKMVLKNYGVPKIHKDFFEHSITSMNNEIRFLLNKALDLNSLKFVPEEKIENKINDVEEEDLYSEMSGTPNGDSEEVKGMNINYHPENFFNQHDSPKTKVQKLNIAINSLEGLNGEKLTRTQRVKRNKILRAYMKNIM